jgi:predicted Zn-dependent peptidase
LATTKPLYDLQRYTLQNGLRLWCVPRPNSQTVALMVQVAVGSRVETEANNGISHFLEHLVFTGTERWSEAEVTDVVRRRGGECNAQTSREETTYYLHIAAEELEFGLDWLHQVLFKPTLTKEKFEKERQVIINEKGGEIDYLRRAWEWVEDHNLGWSVARALRRRVFPGSSFLLPIIGSDKSLNAITHEDLLAHYQNYYPQ